MLSENSLYQFAEKLRAECGDNRVLFQNKLRAVLMNDKPLCSPKKLAKYLNGFIPEIKVIKDRHELAARRDMRQRVIESLVNRMTEFAYNQDVESEHITRMERRVEAYLEGDKKAEYNELIGRITENNGTNADDINRKNAINIETVRTIADDMERLISSGQLTDRYVADNFSSLMKKVDVMNEAKVMLDKIMTNMSEEKKVEIQKLQRKVENVMVPGAQLMRRMLMVTDPNYTNVNLEAMYTTEMKNLRKLVGARDAMNEKFNKFAGKSLVQNVKDYWKKLRKNKNVHIEGEGIYVFPTDIASQRCESAAAILASKLDASSWATIDDKGIICGRDGNTFNPYIFDLAEALEANGGIVYAIDKNGVHEPIPVMYSYENGVQKILIGQDEIEASVDSQPDEPVASAAPAVSSESATGFWARVCNFFRSRSAIKKEERDRAMRTKEIASHILKKSVVEEDIPDVIKCTATKNGYKFDDVPKTVEVNGFKFRRKKFEEINTKLYNKSNIGEKITNLARNNDENISNFAKFANQVVEKHDGVAAAYLAFMSYNKMSRNNYNIANKSYEDIKEHCKFLAGPNNVDAVNRLIISDTAPSKNAKKNGPVM